MSSAVFFQIQSVLIYSLLLFGVYKRKNRNTHVRTMYTVLAWDVILILQIELTRSAIAKASKAMVNPMILNVHVSFALSSVLLYLALFITGRKLLAGNHEIRSKHKFLGWSAVVLRTLTLITSFYAVIPKN
jgi:hypothetical protein